MMMMMIEVCIRVARVCACATLEMLLKRLGSGPRDSNPSGVLSDPGPMTNRASPISGAPAGYAGGLRAVQAQGQKTISG